jgi:hypothetical protein
MKHIIMFENASVVSVCNGEITLNTECGLVKYHNASLQSVCDGRIELIVEQGLQMSDLKTGMLVQYTTGEYRLVIKINDSLIRLAELRGGGCGTITPDGPALLRCIKKVWESRTEGSLDRWMNIDSDRKVIFEL